MWRFRRLLAKLTNLLRHQRAEQEMNREISSHLALLQDEFERQGLPAEQARKAALRAYGGVEQSKELHRAERSIVWIEQGLQDLRHACRTLLKSPIFAAVGLVSMALGIGVNTAIFTLVNGVLLKTLPIAQPQRVVQVSADMSGSKSSYVSFPVFRQLRSQTDIFSDVVGFSQGPAVLEVNGEQQNINSEFVTGSYFSFFGARPALGRLIDEGDDQVEAAHPICVLSYAAWQRYFRGSPDALHQTITLSGVSLQIVGVARSDFVGAELQQRYDLWLPTAMVTEFWNPRETQFWFWLNNLARLKAAMSISEAAARLASASPSIAAALSKQPANPDAIYRIQDASRGFDTWRSSLKQPLFVLMGAVALVLLVACANLANLLLARATDRHQEFAIKLSLGVSRWRLLRQLLVETALLALGGGFAGILGSLGLTRVLLDLFNTGNTHSQLYVAPDAAVLEFTFSTCLLTSLIAGLYPAFQASRTDVSAALKGASLYGLRRSYVRRGLIVLQVTLAVTLLFGATLFAHSLSRLKTVDLGYDIKQILTVGLALRGPRSVRPLHPPLTNVVSNEPSDLIEVLDGIRALPNVESAALCEPGVLSGGGMASTITVRDSQGIEHTSHNVHFVIATSGYLSTLRIPLKRGRDFGESDHVGSTPVCIVSQALASALWPGEDPIGKHMKGWNTGSTTVEVIGVVGNSKYSNVREGTEPIAYQPPGQTPGGASKLEVRCRGDLVQAERDIRQIVSSLAPSYQVSNAASMELMRDSGIAQDRLLAFLSSLFAGLATVLALVGIYGLISYSVSRRTREVGVRMSLGAAPAAVLWLFLREVSVLILAGLAVGLPLSLLLAAVLKSMLFEVSTSDPAGIVATVSLMALGGLVASLLPALTAARLNPVQALRYE